MPSITFNALMTDLKKKAWKPLYILHGEEPYYIDRVSDYIEHHVLSESEKEFNQSILYGRDLDVLTLLGTAKRYPMMSAYQVVIVKEAQDLKNLFAKSKDDDDDKKEKADPFVSYLEKPVPTTILVICHKYKSIDKRMRSAKLAEKNGVLFESKKLYDNQVPDWVENYLKEKNYSISPRASALISDHLGTDLQKISNELDKMLINLPPKTEIDSHHVEEYIGISHEFNIFEMQDAIGRMDVVKVNRIVNYFADNPKNNPLVLTLGGLNSYFTKLLRYHSLDNKTQAASALGINPYFIKDFERASKNYSFPKLTNIMSVLREYDLRSKGVDNLSTGEGELLKEMMYRIMH